MRGHQICEGRKKKGERAAQGRLASASSDNIRPGNLFKKFNIQQSPAAAPELIALSPSPPAQPL